MGNTNDPLIHLPTQFNSTQNIHLVESIDNIKGQKQLKGYTLIMGNSELMEQGVILDTTDTRDTEREKCTHSVKMAYYTGIRHEIKNGIKWLKITSY